MAATRYIAAMQHMDHSAFRNQLVESLISPPDAADLRRQPPLGVALPAPKRFRLDLGNLPQTRLDGKHPLMFVERRPGQKDPRKCCKLCYALLGLKKKVTSYCGNPNCGLALCLEGGHWNMWHLNEVLPPPNPQ